MKPHALFVLLLGTAFLGGCVTPGQVNRHATPGHIMQSTGYNPASGKVKWDNPGKGKGKAKKKGW